MAIESILVFGLGALVLLVVSIWAGKPENRSESNKKDKK